MRHAPPAFQSPTNDTNAFKNSGKDAAIGSLNSRSCGMRLAIGRLLSPIIPRKDENTALRKAFRLDREPLFSKNKLMRV